MYGVVIAKDLRFHCASVESQAGRTLVNFTAVPADAAGRKYLLPGEEIEFDILRCPGNRISTKAVNVRILTPREPVNIRTYREVGQVEHVRSRGLYAWLKRGYFTVPGIIFLDHKEVATPRAQHFAVGDFFEYSVEPPCDGRNVFNAYGAVQVETRKQRAA